MSKLLPFFVIVFFACHNKVEKITPTTGPVTESIYASGIIKGKNQYDVFASVSGIVEEIPVNEGDTVSKGSIILVISNETQKLNRESAGLAAQYSSIKANRDRLNNAQLQIDLARERLKNDSALYFRQQALWQQQVGTKVELEQRELAYQNSKTTLNSAIVAYHDLKREIDFNASRSQKNLQISGAVESDFVLRSKIDGIVYNINKEKGEIVSPQTPLATLGDAREFVLEMQVDESDIMKIRKGFEVLVMLDSYKGSVFEARITRINPLMNERSKTFLVEAEFTNQPEVLYPNTNFEASIVIQKKEKALLVPRDYILNDSLVIKSGGDTVAVATGLKDYRKVEILSGIGPADELIKPIR